MKKKFNSYNDGVAFVYRAQEKRTDFGAKKNVSSLSDMDFVAKFDFEECSKREQDYTFAEQKGFTLSLKVKTRYAPGVDSKCKAVIDNYLYDIWAVDKTKTEMYLFMEGVKPIDS